MHKLEKDVEARLVRRVTAMGGRAYKWVSPGNVGVPDRIVIWPGGRIDMVELKTDTGRLSQIQEIQIRRLQALGCKIRVLYGDDDVDAYLSHAKKLVKAGEAT
ncbi:MAG: VRR-NUC domain-containing protein [Succiniclasticum sp.]|nr:VRR-NUC domain-containing protein [Succiniclasticum sp.]